jgi:hypothetical protein
MKMMKLDGFDLLLPPIAATVFWILGWSSTRAINKGRPLNPNQRMIAAFGFWFMLGAAYSMVAVGAFKLPHWAWIPPALLWMILVGFVLWRRRERHRQLAANKA